MAKPPINNITQPKTLKPNSLCMLVCPCIGMANYDFFISKRNQDGSPPRVNYRRCQQEEMLPSYLVRVPGLINHWNSSLAWVLDQNLQMFSDCKGAAGLSFSPFLIFILIVLIFPSQDEGKEQISPHLKQEENISSTHISSENCLFHSSQATAFSSTNDSFLSQVDTES